MKVSYYEGPKHLFDSSSGLRQDSTGNAMLDGQKGGNWNYVAASKVLFLGTSLPGPVVDEGGKVQKLTDLVELFVVLVA